MDIETILAIVIVIVLLVVGIGAMDRERSKEDYCLEVEGLMYQYTNGRARCVGVRDGQNVAIPFDRASWQKWRVAQ